MNFIIKIFVVLGILGTSSAFYFFHRDTKKCLKSNGSFPKPGSLCRSYYLCKNWVPVERMCPKGQHFVCFRGRCDWIELFPCFEKPTRVECIRPNGKFLKPNTQCKVYYQCCNGNPTEKSCPEDLLFNPTLEKCDWSELYTCVESTSTTRTMSTSIITTTARTTYTALPTTTTSTAPPTTTTPTAPPTTTTPTAPPTTTTPTTTTPTAPPTTTTPTAPPTTTTPTAPPTTTTPTAPPTTTTPTAPPTTTTPTAPPTTTTPTFPSTTTTPTAPPTTTTPTVPPTTTTPTAPPTTTTPTIPPTTTEPTTESLTTEETVEATTKEWNESELVCPEKNGWFPHPYDKHKFIACNNGHLSVLTCPSNLVYDHQKRACVYPKKKVIRARKQ